LACKSYQTSANYEYDTIYELKNGKIEQLHEGLVTMREWYQWDHNDVSQEEYALLLKNACNKDEAVACEFSDISGLVEAIKSRTMN